MTFRAHNPRLKDAQKPSGMTDSVKLPPEPKESFLFGHLPQLIHKGLHRLVVDAWHESGGIFRLKLGKMGLVIISQPKLVKYLLVTRKQNYDKRNGYKTLRESLLGNGLLTSDGELWQRQRRLIQPLFTAKAVLQYAPVMINATQQMQLRWQPSAERCETLDISNEMMRLAMSIIGQTMLSLDVGDQTLELGRAFRTVLEYISKLGTGMRLLPSSIPTPTNRRYHAAVRLLDTFVYQQLQERRTQQERPSDLLTRLIEARDKETGEGMSDQQIRDEVLTIFIAGHETTALVLTWVWYLLATNPEVERKLHEELATVLGRRIPTVDDLLRLPYTRMVFEETMRLYPPAWIFPRDAIEDDEIGTYSIPAGTMVLACPYLTHRDPDLWERPEEFEPERFTAEHSLFAYYPFGVGSRSCLGNHFAMLEGQLIIAIVAQQYQLRPVPGFVPEPKAIATLRLPHGMPMTLHLR